ncbi:MAG: exonuclease domain-containing protein [Oscillospiraceae bacterium]|nr:exonuclease domain-containing protein [Oscillospiraceae bacterium]
MIVMDLEWNRSYDRKKLDEILQIGAVRTAYPGGPITDSFCVFIRPRVHKSFDPGARKQPDLQCAIDSEETFASAWAAFRAWCGDDRVFAFWGPDDFGVIRQNCAYWGVDAFEPEKVYNYQRAFSHAYGSSSVAALWRVVDYLGIPDVFEYHNALYDAMYTALVGAWLRQEDLEDVPQRRGKRRR